MKLSIGMAVYDDFDGAYFSIQAIKMYHRNVLDQIELIVVDNKPDSQGSPSLQDLVQNKSEDMAGAKYIPMTMPTGTTQPRNRIFEEATGDAVLCMDSHVLLWPDSLTRLISYYRHHPLSKDLLSGPIMYDNLTTHETHFDNKWRSQMWGVWGRAWACECGYLFSVHQSPHGEAEYHQLNMGFDQIETCPACHKAYPRIPYAGYQQALINANYHDPVSSPLGTPFEIPAMGLGLFTCQRDAWLGFNRHFRGFGGEEMYIHEKYRQAGRKALCLPWLRWGHRFGRPSYANPNLGILTLWNKVRNYVLGFKELGFDYQPIFDHFVANGPLPRWEWDALIDNPEGRAAGPGRPPQQIMDSMNTSPKENPAPGLLQPPRASNYTEGELLAWVKGLPRDLDKHLDTLAHWASKSDHVTEVTHRRESTVALLAAKHVVSYQAERDPLVQRMLDMYPAKLDVKYIDIQSIPQIEETDFLFLDTIGSYNRLYAELLAYCPLVRKQIAIHDTQLYMAKGEDGNPKGMLMAMRDYMRQHPEWSVVYHTKEQHGLTIISRLAEDKPQLPNLLTKAANFTQSLAKHVMDGRRKASTEDYESRLTICSGCPQRNENSCSVCGCRLDDKASWASSECPLGLWLAVPVAPAPQQVA